MAGKTYQDANGRPYAVRNGRSVWLPEPVYLDARGRRYTVRSGQSAWVDGGTGEEGALEEQVLFSLSFDQSLDDIAGIAGDLRSAGPLKRQRSGRIAVLLAQLAATMLLLVWSAIDGETLVSAFLAGAALIYALLIVGVLIGLASTSRRARDLVRIDPFHRAVVLGTQTVTATTHGIRSGGALQEFTSAWELVSEVVRGRHAVIVFSGSRFLIGIPLRAFAASGGVEDFEALVREHSGAA